MLRRVLIVVVLVAAKGGFLLAAAGRGGRGPLPPGSQGAAPGKVTAVRAGRLVDPESGTAAANQVVLIEGERITNVGANVPIPQGAEVIDLSSLTVLPGLVDTHTHE